MVSTCGLAAQENKTYKYLALALLKVDKVDIALEVYSPIKEHWQHHVNRFRHNNKLTHISIGLLCLVFGLLCLVFGIIFHYCAFYNDVAIPNINVRSLLPANETLFGRDEEVDLIMQYHNDKDVQVVTLFGSPGKSAIAKHIGHIVLLKGIDVYYVFVEDLSVNGLQDELIKISGVIGKIRFNAWVSSITKETLLIIDNVDGDHRVQDKYLA